MATRHRRNPPLPHLPPVEEIYATRFDLIIGVDEAGRGALAGPVGVAACVHHPLLGELGAADSKTLTPQQREEVAARLANPATRISHAVLLVDVAEVEKRNVLGASLWGMAQVAEQLIAQLKPQNPLVLVDGNRPLSGFPWPQQTCVKGDATHACIGAASILAKVARDAHMGDLHRQYPQYGFDRHKGYGTAAHRGALLVHGPCPQHRTVFLRKVFSAG